MIEPIKDWAKLKRGYTFNVPTFYSKHHLGLDVISPAGTPIYAWQDLTVTKFSFGTQGGNTIQVICKGNKRLFRLMHLQKPVKPGEYKEGQILAYVGNTGKYSRGAHLHIDITPSGKLDIKNINNFEDPEAYFKWLLTLNNKPMTKAKFVKESVGKGVGVYIPADSEQDLIIIAGGLGLKIPTIQEGGAIKVDWKKLKYSGKVELS